MEQHDYGYKLYSCSRYERCRKRCIGDDKYMEKVQLKRAAPKRHMSSERGDFCMTTLFVRATIAIEKTSRIYLLVDE